MPQCLAKVQQISTRSIQAGTFLLCLLPFLMVQLLPSQLDQVMEKSSYLVFHNVAEVFSIMVSLCVFSVGWYTYDQSKDPRALLLGTAFLVVGLLDFMHTLSNAAMPPFITPNSTNKSTQFWIAARLVDASAFLASALVFPEKAVRRVGAGAVVAAALALAAAVFTAVICFPEYLPATAIPGVGLTPLKRYLEFVVIALLFSSWLLYSERMARTGDRNLLFFLTALIICIFSEAVFASYKTGFDTYNVLGHVYKVVAFYLIYKGIFASAVRKPYRHLSQANENLVRLNRLYTVLSETNKVVVRAKDRETLFRGICQVAVAHGGFRMAWIGMLNEQSGILEPVAWSGEEGGYLEGIRIRVADEAKSGGPTGIVIRRGGLQVCSDIAGEACPAAWTVEAQKRGFASSAAIAITLHDTVIGAFTMHAAEKDFFHGQLADLLSQLAAEISFGLESLELETRRRETERALQEETLERLRIMESLYEKDRQLIHQSRLAAMGEMINNIAHQWRQPLNVVGLIVQELQIVHQAGECSREYMDGKVDKLKELIFHMSQTIDDFREFFRPDREKEFFRVRTLVSRTLSLIQDSLQGQQIEVDVKVGEELEMYGYPNQYSQVLLNILMNARDAFAERPVEGERRITIAAASIGERDVVTVTDNAGGMPEEIMHKIFEPYFTTKGPGKGSGVGLYMSKLIIDHNMNGRLSARNTGDGAEFHVAIPRCERGGAVAECAVP